MSDTPRTDQIELDQMDDFARTLEREIQQILKEIQEAHDSFEFCEMSCKLSDILEKYSVNPT